MKQDGRNLDEGKEGKTMKTTKEDKVAVKKLQKGSQEKEKQLQENSERKVRKRITYCSGPSLFSPLHPSLSGYIRSVFYLILIDLGKS